MTGGPAPPRKAELCTPVKAEENETREYHQAPGGDRLQGQRERKHQAPGEACGGQDPGGPGTLYVLGRAAHPRVDIGGVSSRVP